MISPALAVQLSAAIYRGGEWDRYDPGHDDGVCWALKRVDGHDVIVFRGSSTLQDWLVDFRALPLVTPVGSVHSGFFSGMEQTWSDIRPLLRQPVILTGHSLGAARASILAGLMIVDGHAPAGRIVFGEPRPGLADFAGLVKAVPGFSFRNGDASGHDPVTDVPPTIPPFNFTHPLPITAVTAMPSEAQFAVFGQFAWHLSQQYEAAIAALKTGDLE